MKHTKRTYRQTLDFLFTQLPMFQRVGATAFKKDLTNIRLLLKALGQPQDRFRSIHLAGTNGKGSTAHMLSAILQTAGFKTGLYTSPHYKDFRERIKINGQYIARQKVVEFVAKNESLFEEIRPSFFEITVAMAFAYFAEEAVDVAIVETGLGGRLDSTNVLQPDLSIITNISLDHQQFLGETLPEIAGEKAGIIKEDVPVVIGEEQAATKAVFREVAKAKKAPLRFASRRLQVRPLQSSLKGTSYEVDYLKKPWLSQLKTSLTGPFQAHNLATALEAFKVLQKQAFYQSLEDAHLHEGLQQVQILTNFKGRWQVIGQHPLILCDSAHNEAGIQLAMQTLLQQPHKQLHIVFGMVNDKSPDKILQYLPTTANYYFAKANIPRGLDAQTLRSAAKQLGLAGRHYSSVRNALRAAKRAAQPQDLIYVGGSIFVLAEVLP